MHDGNFRSRISIVLLVYRGMLDSFSIRNKQPLFLSHYPKQYGKIDLDLTFFLSIPSDDERRGRIQKVLHHNFLDIGLVTFRTLEQRTQKYQLHLVSVVLDYENLPVLE